MNFDCNCIPFFSVDFKLEDNQCPNSLKSKSESSMIQFVVPHCLSSLFRSSLTFFYQEEEEENEDTWKQEPDTWDQGLTWDEQWYVF